MYHVCSNIPSDLQLLKTCMRKLHEGMLNLHCWLMKPLQSGNTYTMPALQGNRFHKNINMFIEKTEVYDVRKD